MASDAKYSLSQLERWRLERNVTLSDHALDRYDERAPAGAVAPETAYEQADGLGSPMRYHESFVRSDGRRCDRVLYYSARVNGEPWGVCFLRVDDPEPVVVTVVRFRQVSDAAMRAYLWARAAGGEGT